jgi:formyltetrahydrofolate deformylase
MRRLILTVTCPDGTGIVAAVTGFIADHGGWVVEAAQHGDLVTGRFFQRIEVLADSLPFGPDEFGRRFARVAQRFELDWQLRDSEDLRRVVVLVGKEDHCLADLLHRRRSGDLACEIPLVISNHPDLAPLVEWHGIEFRHLPFPLEGRGEAFDQLASLFDEVQGDVMVLARFMQVLPAELCDRYAGRIINIHHSFLPSFAGARPYHQAFDRGVKLIGATCHYVTAELDAGPIIEQDAARIDHADTVEDLLRIGRDIERSVLVRGLRWHLEDRVLLNGDRTVIFG